MKATISFAPSVRAFDQAITVRETALKVLEEAAECVEAAKHLEEIESAEEFDAREAERSAMELRSEMADVIQAVANLAASCGVYDLEDAQIDCMIRNARRGRISE